MNWTDFKAYAARGTWKNTLRKNGLWLAGRAALYFFSSCWASCSCIRSCS